MANTYSQLYVQLVFATYRRTAAISPEWENELHKYISGIISNKKHKLICINGTEDHIHILVGFNVNQSISSLVQDIKRSTSLWINENNFTKGRFEWQEGYGAFSYSKSQLKDVIKYIENQKEHHKKTSFIDEFKTFLKIFEVSFEEKYIFRKPD